MEDEEEQQIINEGGLLLPDSPPGDDFEADLLQSQAMFLEDDFYQNERAAKATVMKMRNSNALIYFPEADLMEENKEEEEKKPSIARSQTVKETAQKLDDKKKRDKTAAEPKRGFFEKLFGINKPVKEKVTHSIIKPLEDIPKEAIDSLLISAEWDLPKHQTINIIENYDKVSENHEWLELHQNKNFGFFPQPIKKNSKKLKYTSPAMQSLHMSITRKVFDGMDHLNREARIASWMVLLGIDIESSEVESLRMDYHMVYMNSEPSEPGSEQDKVEKQINKDCIRTFSETKKFSQPGISRQNRLFNVLKAYSYYDPELGYTQGLNFIAAMILLKVDDESVAFVILIRLLKKDQWRRFYLGDTPKLFEVSKTIKRFINK